MSKQRITFSAVRTDSNLHGETVRWFDVCVDGRKLGHCYRIQGERHWHPCPGVRHNFRLKAVRGHTKAKRLQAAIRQDAAKPSRFPGTGGWCLRTGEQQ